MLIEAEQQNITKASKMIQHLIQLHNPQPQPSRYPSTPSNPQTQLTTQNWKQMSYDYHSSPTNCQRYSPYQNYNMCVHPSSVKQQKQKQKQQIFKYQSIGDRASFNRKFLGIKMRKIMGAGIGRDKGRDREREREREEKEKEKEREKERERFSAASRINCARGGHTYREGRDVRQIQSVMTGRVDSNSRRRSRDFRGMVLSSPKVGKKIQLNNINESYITKKYLCVFPQNQFTSKSSSQPHQSTTSQISSFFLSQSPQSPPFPSPSPCPYLFIKKLQKNSLKIRSFSQKRISEKEDTPPTFRNIYNTTVRKNKTQGEEELRRREGNSGGGSVRMEGKNMRDCVGNCGVKGGSRERFLEIQIGPWGDQKNQF